jgi:hypothetical protein
VLPKGKARERRKREMMVVGKKEWNGRNVADGDSCAVTSGCDFRSHKHLRDAFVLDVFAHVLPRDQ